MMLPFYFIAFLAGLLIGSFLNVCIYRIPLGRSIVTPRSYCPFCGRVIKWSDNIPLISFVFLKGKCRSCKRPIPIRYFMVEILTGILAVMVYRVYYVSPQALVYFVFVSVMVLLAFIDIEHKEVPDIITLPGMAFGLLASAALAFLGDRSPAGALLNSFLGIIAGGASMFALGMVGEIIFRKEALGGGDVKLMAMIGAFLGWQMVLLTFFIAPVFGSVGGLIMKIRYRSEVIAYAPYLCGAAIISLFWGENILEILLSGYGF